MSPEGGIDPREPGLVIEPLAPTPLQIGHGGEREVVRVRGPLAVAAVAPEVADVLKALNGGRVVLAEALGPDRERPVVQRLSLVVPPDKVVPGGEDVQRRRDVGVVGAEGLLAQLDELPVAALAIIEEGGEVDCWIGRARRTTG